MGKENGGSKWYKKKGTNDKSLRESSTGRAMSRTNIMDEEHEEENRRWWNRRVDTRRSKNRF